MGSLGLYGDNGKENGNHRDCSGYIVVNRVYLGIMDNKMETTIMGLYGECSV